jgi:hypothetical protein
VTQPPPIDCTWLLVDTSARVATFELIAGFTSLNGALNFNGFQSGGLTVTVPLNWTVALRLTNRDDAMPHSAQVIDSVRPLPGGPVNPAFPGAATARLMQGIDTGQEETIRFVANKAGSFWIWCAVPGHGIAGMWIRLKVSPTDKRPTLARSVS